jgi:hypothetical protein
MSNFSCPICHKPILEGKDGSYITGCMHYPVDYAGKIKEAVCAKNAQAKKLKTANKKWMRI